jgi:flagellar hook-associated protein 2
MNTFLQGLLDSDGTITSKTKSLQSTLTRNAKEQEKIQDRIERVEARLLAQYSRLDTTLSKLNALNSYVAQQITTWNSQSDN